MIFFILIVEGFISIYIEILAIRQLIPFIGTNVINTSIIIGAFLLALSFGYAKGGQVQKDFYKVLAKNLFIVLFLFGIGFSYFFLEALYYVLGNKYLFLIGFSFLILGPIVFFIGQTIPILSNLFKEKTAGELSGKILFLSTFGSFLGSIGTSLLLINIFGVSYSIIFIIILISILIYLLRKDLSIFLLSFILVFFNSFSFFIKDNLYSNISIVDENQTKFLILNRSMSSSYDGNESTFWYAKKIKEFITEKNKNILVAGAGGFTLGINDKNNKYTFVDIDKDLKEVSEKYFLKKNINGVFIPKGIREYLREGKKFDIIISDVYQNTTNIPPYLTTKEYYLLLKDSLNSKGYVLFNIIQDPLFRDSFSRHMNNTITSVFNCIVIPKSFKKRTNVIYKCYPKKDNSIYTDNLTNLLEFDH
jgi:predicted membrane-bound spermidine synthase